MADPNHHPKIANLAQTGTFPEVYTDGFYSDSSKQNWYNGVLAQEKKNYTDGTEYDFSFSTNSTGDAENTFSDLLWSPQIINFTLQQNAITKSPLQMKELNHGIELRKDMEIQNWPSFMENNSTSNDQFVQIIEKPNNHTISVGSPDSFHSTTDIGQLSRDITKNLNQPRRIDHRMSRTKTKSRTDSRIDITEIRSKRRREFHKIHTRRSRAKLNEKMEMLRRVLPEPPSGLVVKSKAQVIDYAIRVLGHLSLGPIDSISQLPDPTE